MSLTKKTETWVGQHIITREQQQQILAFERSHTNRTFWITAFVIAGILIGLGICLLIAANWQVLPELVKLVGDFALLGVLTYATYWSMQTRKTGLRELFSILSFLAIGATIGLIAQIFHLSGGWTNFAGAWALLGLPFIWLSRSTWINLTWWCLVLTTCPWKHVEKFFSYVWDEFTCLTVLFVIGLYILYNLLKYLVKRFDPYTRLPRAAALLLLASCYLSIAALAALWGLWRTQFPTVLGVHATVFGFLALRLYTAVKEQQITSFKRNAVLTEIYIFLIFMFHTSSLWLSGLGFIGGGLLILILIYCLRQTTRYIKQMEIFK